MARNQYERHMNQRGLLLAPRKKLPEVGVQFLETNSSQALFQTIIQTYPNKVSRCLALQACQAEVVVPADRCHFHINTTQHVFRRKP